MTHKLFVSPCIKIMTTTRKDLIKWFLAARMDRIQMSKTLYI